MKIAAVSELKAKLARYLRMVKSGEDVEIHERGVPIARLSRIKTQSSLAITPPQKPAETMAKYRFSVKPKAKFEVVDFLREDREKR